MPKLVTAVLGFGILALWGSAVFFGYTIASGPNNQIPESVRSSPGGYRAWAFWHAGEHGGK